MNPRNASAPEPIQPELSEQMRDLQLALERTQRELTETQAERDQALAQEERARATLAGAVGKYFFELKSSLSPVSNKETVGFDVPEGIRLHVDYVPDGDKRVYEVATDLAAPLLASGADGWHGITGKILTGGDWVLVRKNGVARFDARVTIKTDDDVLIDAVFSGDVDLAAAVPSLRARARDVGAAVYDAYRNGTPEVTELPVALSVRFEAAEQPYLRPGEDDSWIEKSRYNRQRKNFPKYQRLVRGLFVARGNVTLRPEKRWPPREIALRIFELV